MKVVKKNQQVSDWDFDKIKRGSETNYVAVIQNLPTHISEKGTLWLQKIVDIYCRKAQIILPALNMFNA